MRWIVVLKLLNNLQNYQVQFCEMQFGGNCNGRDHTV